MFDPFCFIITCRFDPIEQSDKLIAAIADDCEKSCIFVVIK